MKKEIIALVLFIFLYFVVFSSFDFVSAEKHLEIGKKLKAQRQYQKALFHFRKALEKNPKLPEVNLEIGKIHFSNPKLVSFDEALDRFSLEISISNHPYAYHERGILFGYLRRWKEAEDDFRKERSLWKSWGADLNLAWILFSQNKLNEAEKILEEANQNFPNNLWILNGLGVIYLNQGKIDSALKTLLLAFEKSQSLTPEDYRKAYPNNDPSLAKEEIANIQAGIAFNIALAYEKLGDLKNALVWYNKTKELMNGRNHIHIAEGITLESLSFKIKDLHNKIR